jgi:hypothetical protein
VPVGRLEKAFDHGGQSLNQVDGHGCVGTRQEYRQPGSLPNAMFLASLLLLV